MKDSRVFILSMCVVQLVLLFLHSVPNSNSDHWGLFFITSNVWMAALIIVFEIRKND